MNSTSTLDDKIESTKADILGQVHKVNQQVNDLRTEIDKVSGSLKIRILHKEAHETLDNLLRCISTKVDIIGQVHKVNQHVNDLRVENTKVTDPLKSKHKEVKESLDNLLRPIEQSSVSLPTISLAPSSYSKPPLPSPTNMQVSTVPSIVDTCYPSVLSTDHVAPNQAPMSSGHSNTSSDSISLIPIEVVSDILETIKHEQDINLMTQSPFLQMKS